MDDSEFVPLFSFPCTVETILFSEDLKKPSKHDADFAVGIKRREVNFSVAVKGKADLKRKYYHVRIYLMPLVWYHIDIHTHAHSFLEQYVLLKTQNGRREN